MLTAQNVTVRFGALTAVDGVSLSLSAGQWLMLAGPNGAGKSTLLNAIAQGVRYEGRVCLDGKDLRDYRPGERARRIGVLAQRHDVGYDYTVEEVVGLGRYAHARGFLGGRDVQGGEMVERALRLTGMEPLRGKSMRTLSGGEVQRAFLAQVFAQDPEILLLDEPANHLDLPFQRHIFGLIQDWLAQPGRAALCVVHDLSLARRYGTHAALMHRGRCVAQGETDAVFTPENLRRVYGMDVHAWMREMLAQWDKPTQEC
ncbi:MAG TPA: ABC transporter ATP-binding protein [Candidatus Onthenecus intestinigallinarum]|uniref:ABC transporter ATP-binding protein n=1 Tax=Candidatus Onthenecus intestinigallinarum TaxID=2840875 RepID=A0A9D0Z8U5_9FIRM|nr:ABC transporter ATP-binding protein [Candidatus Onthenecus intestinigallinarum]